MKIIIPALVSLLIALWLCHQKARKKWLWGLSAFILPFPTLWILVQLGKSGIPTKKPSVKGWVGRIILVVFLSLSLVYIGDSPFMNNKTTYAIKAKLAGSLSPNVIEVDGNILRTTSRPFIINSFANTAFALAALGALFGLFAFRLPVILILSQSLLGFVIGFLSSTIQQVFLIEMVLQGSSVNIPKIYKSGFTVSMSILLIISLAIHWMISRRNNPNKASEPTPLEPGDRFGTQGGEAPF